MSLDTSSDSGVLLKSQIVKTNPNGYRGRNTNLPTTWWTSPSFNIATLTNASSEPMIADVTVYWPDVYLFLSDARIYGLFDYRVLRNGVPVDGWRLCRRHIEDNRGQTTTTREVQWNSNGSNSNYLNIIAQPGDTIRVEQRCRFRTWVNGPGQERVYIYQGQTKIEFKPLVDIIDDI